MKHIINFSGGKDSTAMTLKMLEDGTYAGLKQYFYRKVEDNDGFI